MKIFNRGKSHKKKFFLWPIFPKDTPIQLLEDICIIYDNEELSKLKEIIKLKDFLFNILEIFKKIELIYKINYRII